MSKDGVWGDHLTLIAAAELFGTKIVIISSIHVVFPVFALKIPI
jgi:hypothetical protein